MGSVADPRGGWALRPAKISHQTRFRGCFRGGTPSLVFISPSDTKSINMADSKQISTGNGDLRVQAGYNKFVNLARNRVRERFPDLSDSDWSLIEPLFYAGATEADIYKYLADLRVGHQNEQKQENALAKQVAQQRAVGLNPDLTGVGESGYAETPAFQPLPSQGGSGSNTDRAKSVISSMLQFASFGLSAYGTIAGSVAKQGLQLAGLAEGDVLSALGDESGKVVDVPGFIQDMIQKRGFVGARARRYAGHVAARINAYPVVLQRLKNAGDIQSEQSRLQLETYKNSLPYLNEAKRSLDLAQQLTIKTTEADLEEKRQIQEFLKDHPDYTEEKLMAELSSKQEGARKASADADLSEEHVRGARLDNTGKSLANDTAQERLDQMREDNQVRDEENAVRSLQARLTQIELDSIDEMLLFCQKFEKYDEERRQRPQTIPTMGYEAMIAKRALGMDFVTARQQYQRYKKYISKYYKDYRSGKAKFSVSTPVGGVSFSQ